MRPMRIAARVLVAAAISGTILFAGTGMASAATSGGGHAVAASHQSQFVQLQTNFTPEQSAQLDAVLAVQQKQPTSVSSAYATGSGVGILWQGGFDRDHWWMKISKNEVISIGAAVVCRAVFGSISWFVCPPIVAAINWALNQWPAAGGFWAELYTNGAVRAGTW